MSSNRQPGQSTKRYSHYVKTLELDNEDSASIEKELSGEDDKTIDDYKKTLDFLNEEDKQIILDLLSNLMCPGFPVDRRCLNILRKQRVVTLNSFPGTYLGESKTTFPISEHLSPQEFLMKAGFSAFQAYSVCENKRMKGKLTAAITEARVWLNCMTKNQALLLYGLSVKMMTNHMPPLFLQLTEAIANNRIQNMMQLFEYLRVLKLIGKLPLQSKIRSKEYRNSIDLDSITKNSM